VLMESACVIILMGLPGIRKKRARVAVVSFLVFSLQVVERVRLLQE
jgi:hypothetical protein